MAAESTIGLLRVVLSSNSAQFSTEMGKAEKTIGGFEKSAKAAGQSLAKMANDFSGARITSEAAKVAAAVEKVGGASKLTNTELASVNRTLDLAIVKYAKLGQEVPPQIAKLSAEVKALDSATAGAAAPTGGLGSFSGTLGMVGKLLPALTVTGAVATITSLGKAALQSADEIVTFSNRTGVSIDTVQRWKFVAEQTSTSLDAFAQNAYKLGINVSTGTDKVRGAIGELGIAYSDLKAMKPEDQFNTVVLALEGVESATERNRLGQILFGKQFAEIAVSVAEGYTQMKDGANVASDAAVIAAERAGDAWEKAKNLIAANSIHLVGGIAEYVFDTVAAIKLLGSGLDSFTEGQKAKIDELRAAGGEGLAALLDSFNKHKTKDIELTSQAGAANANYVAQLAAVRAEVASLTAEQKQQINAALKLGGVNEELAAAIGVSEEALRMYQSQLSSGSKATSEFAREQEKAAQKLAQFWEQVHRLGKDSIPNLTLQMGKWETVAKDHFTLVDMTAAGYAKARVEAEKWANANMAVLAPSIKNVSAQSILAEEGTTSAFQRIFGSASELGHSITGIFQAAFTGGGGALGAVQSFATQTLSTLMGMIPGIGPFIQGFAGPIIAMLSKLTKRFADFFRGIFGGPSADELAGREAVGAFEDELAGLLTDQQKLEAGGEAWKETVIAIRDAYMAMGRTEEEALADAKRLWEASKQGADAAARVIEEIRRKMNELTGQTHEIDVEVNYRAGDPGNRPFDPNDPDLHHTQPVDPGFAVGTAGRFGSFFKNFGAGMNTRLHGVEAVLRPQDALPFANSVLAGLTPSEVNSSTTSNTLTVLPVLMGGGMSARDIGRAAARYLAQSGLPNNESGVTDAIEAVVGNWRMTYAR